MNRLTTALLAISLVSASVATAVANEWTLNPERSHLAFVSIKAGNIGEVHHFTELAGSINDQGQAVIDTTLDSVETLIPIRNERMREMLFKTTQYSNASLSAKIDPAQIAAMQPGDIIEVVAESSLSLHGETQPLILKMQAAKLDDDTLMVASTEPVVLDAAKFGLGEGVEKLREIAGLDSISNAVPVTFVMVFDSPTSADDSAAAAPSAETMAQYEAYREIVEAMSSEQKEAVAALFGAAR
ncbi:YceI family protein [Lamprobacter modestohalophilus]|uniref:YceI family protein n=1 Tax=Lamprobacter modestohalophilus TaxID=1064514 RepID=UPI002ADECB9B|nr:YceI family protein [Lamprobacter modestohalophilus]MEA1050827.1 YceI family protein [Lamprobacter modestohalophilus]